nr:MAG TPA: hypothetical protein [Caudoviricetes sp.]
MLTPFWDPVFILHKLSLLTKLYINVRFLQH